MDKAATPGTQVGFSTEHRRFALGAAALGSGPALGYLAAEYHVLPARRMRAARLWAPAPSR